MSSRKGFSLFRKKKDKQKKELVDADETPIILSVTPKSSLSAEATDDVKVVTREMSDERFQELLDESRRSKSDWIDSANEETETNLWPVLRKESNILKLTNQLHPNQNQWG
ncbi:hypothetical protein WA556_000364 [Blastocystis sp. ATCC 50177/Nand II]